MAGEKLVNLIFDAANDALPPTNRTDVVWGTVVTPNPITIKVDGENGMILSATFLKLSPLCQIKTFTIPQWQTEIAEGHTHTIPPHLVTVWRGLLAGDRVMMLRYKNGEQYYVLQRESVL